MCRKSHTFSLLTSPRPCPSPEPLLDLPLIYLSPISLPTYLPYYVPTTMITRYVPKVTYFLPAQLHPGFVRLRRREQLVENMVSPFTDGMMDDTRFL